MKKHLIFFSILISVSLSIANANNGISDVEVIKISLENQKSQLEEAYRDSNEKCKNSKFGFNINMVGMSALNAGLGSDNKSSISCQRAQQLEKQLAFVDNKLEQANITISILKE